MMRSFLVLITLLTSLTAFAEIKPFTFIHISDPHIGTPGHAERLDEALKDAEVAFPDAAFVIDTGDLTEKGYPEEFKKYASVVKKSKLKVYSAVGNHDARWSENGKEDFKKYIGPTYRKVDHNGVRIICLDVAMLIEQYAHFDGLQVSQLKKDLDSMEEGGAAILAMHHPPLSEGRYFDNEFEFAELIRNYNVPLVCDGHGHAFQRYEYNNTTFAMGGSTYNRGADVKSYRVYKVTPDHIELLMRAIDQKITSTETTIPVQRAKDTIGKLVQEEASGTSDPGELSFRLELKDGTKITDATYLLDGATTGPAASVEEGRFTLDPATLSAGDHQIVATVVDDKGTTHLRPAYFRTEADRKRDYQILHEFPLLSGVQSHPTIENGILYVGSNDAHLRAIDLETRETLWEANLNREILSKPVVTTTSVILGSLDGHLYSLDKKTGKRKWKYKAKGAILASPLVTTDTVYIGSGDYHLYAINLKTGKLRWKFKAGRLVKATPALSDDGLLYFGAWDNTIYCLEAKTGKVVWKVPASSSSLFSAATCNPVVVKNSLILVTHDYSVRCLDRHNGAHLWIYKPKKDELGPSYSSPVIYKGVAYMGSIGGRVVGHSIETGEKVFDVDVRPEKTDPLFDSIPLRVGDKLYLGSVGGNFYCVSIPDKKVEWKVALQPGFIFTSPAHWKGRFYVGSLSNKVYEIGRAQLASEE